jgi:hypothetical protein
VHDSDDTPCVVNVCDVNLDAHSERMDAEAWPDHEAKPVREVVSAEQAARSRQDSVSDLHLIRDDSPASTIKNTES